MSTAQPRITPERAPSAAGAAGLHSAQQPDATAKPQVSAALAALQQILHIEREARKAVTLAQLWFVIANEARRAIGARQVHVLEPDGDALRMVAVSSVSTLDRSSITIRWLESIAREATRQVRGTQPACLQTSELATVTNPGTDSYPFPHLLISPLPGRQGAPLAWLMAVRESPFGDNEVATAARLAEAFAHAAEALGIVKTQAQRQYRKPLAAALVAAALMTLVVIPVPLAALAPAEVVARSPFVATMPIDGTIATIPVDPGQSVGVGDALVTLVDTSQRNQLAIAQQEVAVAEAKWRQISLAAFNDNNLRRELSVVASDLAVKKAERDFAADNLARTIIKAERAGIVIFADKRELIGRPAQAGQRLMDIADPAELILRAEAHVEDAVILKEGTAMTFFPDADPLRPVETTLSNHTIQARQTESGTLAFRVDAAIPADAIARLRIGHRGTAQIRGDRVSLGFYLFRRPISAMRQRLGV